MKFKKSQKINYKLNLKIINFFRYSPKELNYIYQDE